MTAPVGSYRLLLAEATTGIVLNADGSRHLDGQGARWEPVFSSREEAVAIKNQLLRQFPFAEVSIFGPDGPPQQFVGGGTNAMSRTAGRRASRKPLALLVGGVVITILRYAQARMNVERRR